MKTLTTATKTTSNTTSSTTTTTPAITNKNMLWWCVKVHALQNFIYDYQNIIPDNIHIRVLYAKPPERARQIS